MSEYEKNCQWHFAEQLGGADIGPNEAMSENFKKNRYASLIRESIQNSLDAVDDVNEPVTVSFQFKKMDANRFPNFFELREDIIGCINFYSGNQNAKEKYQPMLEYVSQFAKQEATMPYLAISDYNTKGMDYQADDTNCPFYAFVQSIGVTSIRIQQEALSDLGKRPISASHKSAPCLFLLEPKMENAFSKA